MEEKCPNCNVTIYVGFVITNGYCPACDRPLRVTAENKLEKKPPAQPVPAFESGG